VKVESAGPTTVQTNEFDGLNRRIVREQTSTGNPKLPERKFGSLLRSNSAASDTYDSFYNETWQLLEERKDGDTDPLNPEPSGTVPILRRPPEQNGTVPLS
jgi:hypothetical protein